MNIEEVFGILSDCSISGFTHLFFFLDLIDYNELEMLSD